MNTEMILFKEDILRIIKLGYEISSFAYFDGKFWRLKNVDNACYFLDRTTKLCKIYENRPVGCKFYPIVFDPQYGFKVDKLCPSRHTVHVDEIVYASKILLPKIIRVLKGEEYENIDYKLSRR